MIVLIRNLSQKALKEMCEELGALSRWAKEVGESEECLNCYNVFLEDGVMIKTHSERVTIDCGAKLYFLDEKDFEKVVIV